jgi:hypothetical protein
MRRMNNVGEGLGQKVSFLIGEAEWMSIVKINKRAKAVRGGDI